ncbi:DUF2478 domain-containing protein [Sinisalibacter aestuarii]|uniref:DUF2478 domain-containing protein n=1 Tax=Sinisalibacter aestuarii TaxID=2949426 RepID=A0ABQ5M0D1_9RHOB|nr:DUF2478 domain-containing protein [Sinisalibacter aestuarii]GKY89977.1 hypothetical protein STA1M1_38460 [Sinisalibacter aestuarii]
MTHDIWHIGARLAPSLALPGATQASDRRRERHMQEPGVPIAYTLRSDDSDTDRLLSELAWHLESRGLRICGTVQANIQRAHDCRCDVDLRVLPEGPVIRISQDLGAGAVGCRLDPGALETAVGIVEDRLSRGADMLIVNRFGKQEAEGRGFRSAIAEALAHDIPVLVGMTPLNLAAFQEFTGGLAEALPPDIAELEDWALTHLADEMH